MKEITIFDNCVVINGKRINTTNYKLTNTKLVVWDGPEKITFKRSDYKIGIVQSNFISMPKINLTYGSLNSVFDPIKAAVSAMNAARFPDLLFSYPQGFKVRQDVHVYHDHAVMPDGQVLKFNHFEEKKNNCFAIISESESSQDFIESLDCVNSISKFLNVSLNKPLRYMSMVEFNDNVTVVMHKRVEIGFGGLILDGEKFHVRFNSVDDVNGIVEFYLSLKDTITFDLIRNKLEGLTQDSLIREFEFTYSYDRIEVMVKFQPGVIGHL